MIVHADIAEGSTVSADVRSGDRAVRVFRVEGVEGDNAPAKIRQAMEAGGIPVMYEPHPTIPLLLVSNKTGTPIDEGTFDVVVTYEPIPPEDNIQEQNAQISIGATVQTVQTNIDRNGDTIELNPSKDTGLKEGYVGTVDVQVPSTRLSFSRREETPPSVAISTLMGKINDAPFVGFPTGSVLCTGINASSSDGGETYNVTYEFQVSNRNGAGVAGADPDWVAAVVYIQDNGKPYPFGSNPSEGIALGVLDFVELYESANFGSLGLSLE